MKLFWSSRSPFARKVAVTAHELGLFGALDLVPVVPMVTRPDPRLAAVNPLMKVPTLQLEDGSVIFDSHVICDWLDQQTGGGRIVPRPAKRRLWALRREALCDGALEVMLALRAEDRRPAEHREPRLIAAYESRLHAVLAAIEADADSITDEIDIGSIATACTLAYFDFRFPGLRWRAGHTATSGWFARFSQRPSMLHSAFADGE